VNIKEFILCSVDEHPYDLVRFTSQFFGVTQQAVSLHLRQLMAAGLIEKIGDKRGTTYRRSSASAPPSSSASAPRSSSPAPPRSDFALPVIAAVPIESKKDEHTYWDEYIKDQVHSLKANIFDIVEYGFGEMMNNVIDHAQAKNVTLGFDRNENRIQLTIQDDGIGVFKKIQTIFRFFI